MLTADHVGMVAGGIVGLVLLASGALKLADPRWKAQAHDLGVPRRAVRAVPIVELVLGATVAVGLGDPWASLGAAALLGAFTVLLTLRLAQGQRPPCACFGRFSSAPISWWSVARNLVLIALALVAAIL